MVHLLVKCNVATKIWKELPWAIRMDCIPFSSSADLVKAILNADVLLNLDHQSAKPFILNAALVLDSIWQARNLLVHQQVPVVVEDIFAGLRRRYAEHSCAWMEVERAAGKRWVPPPFGWLKVNTDVAIRRNGSYIVISLDILLVPSVWFTQNV